MARLLSTFKRISQLFLPIILSLVVGGLLILAAGANPFTTYVNLFISGFSCAPGPGRCALTTMLTFATPLILSGLSATVAWRAGFFSIGQAGQMIMGAGAAVWLGSAFHLPPALQPITALLGAIVLGGVWGLLPALLREYIGVNEIISTLLLNPIAGVAVGLFPMRRLAESARLLPLIPSTKLNAGFVIALVAALIIQIFLWRTGRGFEIRTAAQAPRFASYGGMKSHLPILRAMIISGALAGLAGAVEVLGVQYHFVTTFTAFTDFDGLVVAFVGHLHPLGVVLSSLLLGGLRTGAITGLQIRSHIPQELGGAIIAFILLFVATNRFFRPTSMKIHTDVERRGSSLPPADKKKAP